MKYVWFESQLTLKFQDIQHTYLTYWIRDNIYRLIKDNINLFNNILDIIWQSRNNIVYENKRVPAIEAISRVLDISAFYLSKAHKSKQKPRKKDDIITQN